MDYRNVPYRYTPVVPYRFGQGPRPPEPQSEEDRRVARLDQLLRSDYPAARRQPGAPFDPARFLNNVYAQGALAPEGTAARVGPGMSSVSPETEARFNQLYDQGGGARARAISDHPVSRAMRDPLNPSVPTADQAYQMFRETGYMPTVTSESRWPTRGGPQGSPASAGGGGQVAAPPPPQPRMVSGIYVGPPGEMGPSSTQTGPEAPPTNFASYTRQPQFEGDTSNAGYKDTTDQWVGVPRGDGTFRPTLRSQVMPHQKGIQDKFTPNNVNNRASYPYFGYAAPDVMIDAYNRAAATTGSPTLSMDSSGNVVRSDGMEYGSVTDKQTLKTLHNATQSEVYRKRKDSENAAWQRIIANRQAQNAGFANSYQAEMFRDIMMERAKHGGGRGEVVVAPGGGGGMFNVGNGTVGRVGSPASISPSLGAVMPQVMGQTASSPPVTERKSNANSTAPGTGRYTPPFNPAQTKYLAGGRFVETSPTGTHVEGLNDQQMAELESRKQSGKPRDVVKHMRETMRLNDRQINRVLQDLYPNENRSAARNGEPAPPGITIDPSGMENYGDGGYMPTFTNIAGLFRSRANESGMWHPGNWFGGRMDRPIQPFVQPTMPRTVPQAPSVREPKKREW